MIRGWNVKTLLLGAVAVAALASPTPGRAQGSSVGGPADLNELFAPPTAAERDAVEAHWAARDPLAEGWTVEASAPDMDGFEVHVVSHLVDGHRHYGGIRYPRNFTAGGSYPVLVLNHGGFAGLNFVGEVAAFDNAQMPGTCIEDDFFIVAASYRSELLYAGALGLFQSEGSPSIFDRDVDDVMALLDGTLATIPEADPTRVVVYGASRGGGVSLLLGVRDPRALAVCELMGPTDLFQPWIQAAAEEALDSGGTAANELVQVVMDMVVHAYEGGLLPLQNARLRLLGASAAYFAHRLPRLQVHHGTDDSVVPIEQSESLAGELQALGASKPCFEYAVYPGGSHSVYGLPGSFPVIEAFLCGAAPGAYGSSAAYGSGAPGTLATAPELDVTGCFTPGGHLVAVLSSAPSTGQVLLLAGSQPGHLPLPFGTALLVDPLITVSVAPALSTGGLSTTMVGLPAAMAPGAGFVLQGAVLDAALPGGFGVTRGAAVSLP